jgi:predicted alpha/beta-hydrolase family hydrolase
VPTRRYPAGRSAPTLVLAHGAGAGQDHPWMKRVASGLAARGVSVVTFDFPYIAAGRRTPDRGPVLETFLSERWREAVGRSRARFFAGGKSMGGRIASQVAAGSGLSPAPAGLVFFGYPLHPPGKPERRRDRHLPAIACPMLFLHGTRDPFGSPDEMNALTRGLTRANLHLVNGGDHSLVARKRDDPDDLAIEHALDVAAEWIKKTGA